MKSPLALLFVALFVPFAAADDVASEARGLYDSGRFAEAAKAFETLASAKPNDAALQFNLANALLKSGRLGSATAAYDRAFARNPRDADIRFNYAFALRRSSEDLVPTGIPNGAFRAFTALSERELAGLHWLAAWLAGILGALVLLSRDSSRRQTLTPWAIGAAAAWIIFGAWWAGLRSVLPADRGVIASAHAELRHGPGANFGVAFTIPEGRRVRVLGVSGAWVEVGVMKEGARGWIESSAVERP